MAMNGYTPIGKSGDKLIFAKTGSSGPSSEYKRGIFKKQERDLTLANDEILEEELEAEVLVNKIIGEIETWAGKSLDELLNIERGLNEKIADFAKRLQGSLEKNEELKKEELKDENPQNKSIVNDWIEQLNKIK